MWIYLDNDNIFADSNITYTRTGEYRVTPVAANISIKIENASSCVHGEKLVLTDRNKNVLLEESINGRDEITLDKVIWDDLIGPYSLSVNDKYGNTISNSSEIRSQFYSSTKWDTLEGYHLTTDTLTVTEPESTNFKVDKVWKNTTYAELPNTITLQLGYASDSTQWTEWGEPAILHKEDFGISPVWNYEWTDLPKSINNEPVSWFVKEIKIGEQDADADGTFSDYSIEYSDVTTTNNGFQQTITNTHTVEYTDELPSTGGRGVWYMYCIGLLCIGCVAAFWVYQRKKKTIK